MDNPLDRFIPHAERLLEVVKNAHAGKRLADAASPEFGQIGALLAELKTAVEKADKELDAALAEGRANLLAQAKQIEEQKKTAKAPPAPEVVPFGSGAAFLDQERTKLAIESLCGGSRSARPPARKAEGEEVAAMQTNEWGSGEPPPPPAAAPKPVPKPAAEKPTPPARRQPKKPKVGEESFEWESTGEWEQKGI